MKRAKLGDVYAFKTERGYRLLHWAYYIEKRGEFVRVMPGFYEEIPDNIDDIIDGDCSYILDFAITKLYRKGLLENIINVPISDKYPFPKYCIMYHNYNTWGEFHICEILLPQKFENFIGKPTGEGLPDRYKDVKMVYGVVDPIWFTYLISSDFSMNRWELYLPRKKWDIYNEKYGDLIFGKKSKA